jgi:hypothetical protein
LRCQLVAFQKRFRLLELPLPEIRPEFDRKASNAGILQQSGMPHLARFQEFHRSSTRRYRVLSRQSEGLKRKKPRAKPSKLIAVDIFFSRFCVLILNSVVDLAGSLLSGRASSAYKGIR